MEGLASFEVKDSRQGCRRGSIGGKSPREASDAGKVAGQHGADACAPFNARREKTRSLR